MFKLNTKFNILTDEGFKHFDGINVLTKESYYKFTFENNLGLVCSEHHPIKTISGFITADKLNYTDLIKTKLGFSKIVSKEFFTKQIKLYDPIKVADTKSYYSNDILSHNSEFLGTGDTFISGEILRQLRENISKQFYSRYNDKMRKEV